jgi:gamma-glutamyltranspeptidase / glutathione hydrolase
VKQCVVCPEPLAAEAGAEVFRGGGSAVDAAIAAAYAQTVVSPVMTSIGGTGVMQIFHAPTGRHLVLDFMGYAGSRAREDMFVGHPSDEWILGYTSINVPTFVRGTHAAFHEFGSGRVAWDSLIAPAIRYAEEGFAVYPYIHQYWRADNPVYQTPAPFDGYRMVSMTAACAEIFTVGSRVHAIGERIVQADLARSLRRIAEGGADEFYTGEIGRRMAADLAENGAPVTAEDLATCRLDLYEPLKATYRGLTIATDPFPNVGVFLVELLNMLEHSDLRSLEPADPDFFRLMARAQWFAARDRAVLTDTPRVGPRGSAEHLISKEYARHLIEQPLPAVRRAMDQTSEPRLGGTTQVSAFDRDGSAVSFTHSIGTGSGVVTPGLGFMYNNQMHAYDPRPGRPNSIAPGRPPVTGGGPTIVLRDGRVRFVLGSPHGFRKVSGMGHAIVNLVDFGMSPAGAVTSPRIHCELDPRVLAEEIFFPLPANVAAALRQDGYELHPDLYGARVCLIEADWAHGVSRAASDPRGGGGLAEV